MKIMDFLIQMSFRKGQEGNEVFFPWGIFGKGRVIDNPARKNEFRKFLRSYYIGMFIIIAPWLFIIQPYLLVRDQMLTNILIALGLIMLSLVWYYLGVKPIIYKLPESLMKMTYRDNLKATGKFIHPALIVLLELASLMFVVSGFCIFAAGEIVIGLVAIIFFGFCAIVYGYMLFLRFEKQDVDKISTDTR